MRAMASSFMRFPDYR